jgi:hypothetical protein
MCSINMLHESWLGIEALTIFLVGKQNTQSLDISWSRETRTVSLKCSFLGPNTMNTNSYNYIGSWVVCGIFTIFKDYRKVLEKSVGCGA